MLGEFQTLLNTIYVGCPIDNDLSGLHGYRSGIATLTGLQQVFVYLDDIVSDSGPTVIEQIIVKPVVDNYFKVYFLTKPNTYHDLPI